jgi:hypothetical protein
VSLGVVATSGAASGGRFKVTSTLDGKKVLPARIRWIAKPHTSFSKVTKVEFLVDGHWLWTEHQAPYVYGGDDDHGYGNWLVTSFLKPGRHTFTARVFTSGRHTEADSVRARVMKTPPPPSALIGKWKHQNKAGNVVTISITILGWGTPPGDFWDARYEPGRKIVFGPEEALPHMTPGARLGGFCNSIDPLHTWTYTVAADDKSFNLQPVSVDPCPDRQNGLQGTFTRVG